MVLWNWAMIAGGLDNGELRLGLGKDGNGQQVGQVDMTW